MHQVQTMIQGLESSIEFTNRYMDDLEKSTLPALIQQVATQLAL